MLAISIIAGLAGLVWGAYFVWRGSLIGGCLLVLLLAACFGHPFVNFDVGPLPLTLDRLWLFVLLVAYAARRRFGRLDRTPLELTDWLVLAFVGIVTASTFTHQWQAAIPGQVPPIWRLVGGYCIPLAIYWVARRSRPAERQVNLVHACLALFGVYLAVTGILEANQQWSLVFPRYIADPKLGIHFGRARGPFLQAGTYGMFVAVCMASAWLWRQRLGRFGQVLLLATVPLSLAAIYFSYTRSVWMGAAAGLLIVLGLSLSRAWRPVVLGGMVAAGLLLVAAKWDSLLGFQREQSAEDTRTSAYMRASFGYVSWLMFLDRPLLGCGFGQYSIAQNSFLSDRTSELNLEQLRGYAHHNTFLSLLTETGIIGFGLFMAILWMWTTQAWRLARSRAAPPWARAQGILGLAVLSIYACQAIAYELSFTPLENGLLFMFAGLTSACAPNVASSRHPGAPGRAVAQVESSCQLPVVS